MKTVLVIALCLTVVSALNGATQRIPTQPANQLAGDQLAETQPFSSNVCTAAGFWKQYDRSSRYKTTFQNSGVTKLCMKEYMEPCSTDGGLQGCNEMNNKCIENKRDWANTILYGSAWSNTFQKTPQMCTEEGAKFHDDAMVLVIAQIIFSFIIFLAAYICMIIIGQPSIGMIICGAFMFIFCSLLLFSYYYLNAIVVFAFTMAAIGCFSFLHEEGTAFGQIACLIALFWVTFENGLGWIQHHSRMTAGTMNTDAYEKICNRFYNGYFFNPYLAQEESENPAKKYNSLCDRYWIAAQLCFMIITELMLVIIIAVAAFDQAPKDKPKEPTTLEAY